MKIIRISAVIVWLAGLDPAFAQMAPDPTAVGPNNTISAEYQFAPTVDPDIMGDRNTELWARVYSPATLSGPAPLLIFLHGNHSTCGIGMNPRHDDDCSYTDSGTCPDGYVVVPNHAGYGYIADRLASWGYLVVSINANRGITCGMGVAGDAGLNLARGRLVLKHLQKLSDWNAGREATPDSLGFDLTGQIAFSNVALVGHSRGGEGVRAAYNLYRDTGSPWPARIGPVTFQAIFEIAPVDRQTSRILNADGVVWNTILPMCDGDVRGLSGIDPFDRMLANRSDGPPTPKSTFTIWGANHNFFNTEWQESDSSVCLRHEPIFPQSPGSPQQQQVGRAAVMALIRGNVQGAQGVDPTFNWNFDPLHALPSVVTDVTRVDRGYTDSPDRTVTERIDDFNNFAPMSSWFVPNDTSELSMYGSGGGMPGHDATYQRSAVIWWDHSGPGVYFQPNWTVAGSGRDTTIYQTLELRLDRADNPLNPPGPTDFSIALALDDGSLSPPVLLSTYADLRGPVGGPGGLHLVLQTVRVPLADFGLSPADRMRVRGVRFTFDQTASGVLFFGNLRLSTRSGAGAGDSPMRNVVMRPNANETVSPTVAAVYTASNAGNRMSLRSVAQSPALEPGVAGVEIILSSDQPFPVRDELAILSVGDQQFVLSRYREGGKTSALIFTLTQAEYVRLPSEAPVHIQYGNNADVRWEFSNLTN